MNNVVVALKCLIAFHYIIRRGNFILQDQLSVYPNSDDRNYLNLSHFWHTTDPTTWQFSSWVRWFAQHNKQLLCASRVLGFFLKTASDKESREDRASGLSNADLLSEFDSLVALVEGLCKRPEPNENLLVEEIVKLTRGDLGVVQAEVHVRLNEFKERFEGFKFGEAVQLVCCLKRLEQCEEKMLTTMDEARELKLWDMVTDECVFLPTFML